MKMRPEERTKAIQLGSLTAVVFVLGGFNIYRQMQKSPPAGGATTVTPASETTSNGGSPAYMPGSSQAGLYPGAPGTSAGAAYMPADPGGVRGTKLDMYADNLHEANGSRDPFLRIAAEPDPDASGAQRFHRNTPPPFTPSRANSGFQPTTPTILPGDMTPRTVTPAGLNAGRPLVAQANSAAQNTMDELTLAGVIAGPSSVAVIHVGDRSYQVGDGEKLPNDMSLVRVTDTGIYIKKNSKLMFLEIGKTMRSAVPVKANILPPNSTPAGEPEDTMLSSEPVPYRSETPAQREGPTQVTVNTPSGN